MKPEHFKIPQLPDGRIDSRAAGFNFDSAPLADEADRCDCEKCREVWSKPVVYPDEVKSEAEKKAERAAMIAARAKRAERRAKKKKRRGR